MEQNRCLEEDAKILKDWHLKQAHLPKEIDENLYYTYVSGTKSLEKSKAKLDAYLTLRNRVYNLFQCQPTSEVFIERFKNAGVVFLPGKTCGGSTVLFQASGKFGPTNGDDIMISILIIIEVMQNIEPTQTSLLMITDLKHADPSLAAISLTNYKAFLRFLQRSVASKVKKNILLNTPYFLDKVLSLATSFLPKKHLERLSTYRDESVLYDYLPAEMIPSDYGGKGPSLQDLSDHWAGVILSKKKWFEKQNRLNVDESKRSKDSYDWNNLDIGIEGTFKVLKID